MAYRSMSDTIKKNANPFGNINTSVKSTPTPATTNKKLVKLPVFNNNKPAATSGLYTGGRNTASGGLYTGGRATATPAVARSAPQSSQSSTQYPSVDEILRNGKRYDMRPSDSRTAGTPTTATVYPSDGGDPYTGYVIGGKTYTDPNGQNRIPTGSSVTLQDGRSYVLGPNGVGIQRDAPGTTPTTGGAVGAAPGATQGAAPGAGSAAGVGAATRPPVGAGAKAPGQTTYYTPDGQAHVGYIINGVTYTDPQGQNRIPPYSTVVTDGGTFVYDPYQGGGVPTGATILGNYQTGTDNWMGQLQDSGSAREAAIDAAVQMAIARLDAQRGDISRANMEANRQAELAYITASNPYGVLAQQNEALGLGDSGYAESTMAQLGNTYQQAINENNLAMQAALRQIDLEISDARFNGDIEKANALADLAQQIAAYGMQRESEILAAATGMLGQANSNQWNQKNFDAQQSQQELENSRYDEQWAYQQKQDRQDWGWQMLQAGVINQEVADACGISLADAKAIYSRISAPVSSGGSSRGGGSSRRGSSGSSSGSSGGGTYQDLFKAMYSSGSPSAYLYSNYKKYGIAYAGLSAVMGEYESWVKQQGNKTSKIDNWYKAFLASQGLAGAASDSDKILQNFVSFLNDKILAGEITAEEQKAWLESKGWW